jgi:aminoglycoside 6'-N-acetyltransferase I
MEARKSTPKRSRRTSAVNPAPPWLSCWRSTPQTGRVAYLEGWYVLPESRRNGVGRALVEAAEDWARDQGCSEFASDTDVANAQSTSAHVAVGFEDVGLVRCFRKAL